MNKKTAQADWTRKQILHALEQAGWPTIRALADHIGVTQWTLFRAFTVPYPASEERVAKAIGVPAWVIWPSRYNADGTCKRQSRPGRRKVAQKSTPIVSADNVNITQVH